MKEDRREKGNNVKRNAALRNLTAVFFMLLVFVMFTLNLTETITNAVGKDGRTGIRATLSDMESVDKATYPFVNINGLYQRIMQRGYVYDVDPGNDTIRTKHGQLVSVSSATSRKKLLESAEKLAESSEWLSERDIPLIYVQAPSKMAFSSEQPMPGIKNNTHDKINAFLETLDNNGVEYIDTREWIDEKEQGFYDTDHHWKTETCLDIALRLGRYLNDNHGFDIDQSVLDEANYERTTYHDSFLGAEGRRTGRYYVGLDDFTLITPTFETDFNTEIDSKETGHSTREGSFEKAILEEDKETDHYSFEDSAYYKYWGGDYSKVEVTNKKVPDGGSVLVFKDSYGIPVTAFMTGMFSKMTIIDIRYYEDEKSIKEIIEETKPDAVLYIYGSGYLGKKKMFSL